MDMVGEPSKVTKYREILKKYLIKNFGKYSDENVACIADNELFKTSSEDILLDESYTDEFTFTLVKTAGYDLKAKILVGPATDKAIDILYKTNTIAKENYLEAVHSFDAFYDDLYENNKESFIILLSEDFATELPEGFSPDFIKKVLNYNYDVSIFLKVLALSHTLKENKNDIVKMHNFYELFETTRTPLVESIRYYMARQGYNIKEINNLEFVHFTARILYYTPSYSFDKVFMKEALDLTKYLFGLDDDIRKLALEFVFLKMNYMPEEQLEIIHDAASIDNFLRSTKNLDTILNMNRNLLLELNFSELNVFARMIYLYEQMTYSKPYPETLLGYINMCWFELEKPVFIKMLNHSDQFVSILFYALTYRMSHEEFLLRIRRMNKLASIQDNSNYFSLFIEDTKWLDEVTTIFTRNSVSHNLSKSLISEMNISSSIHNKLALVGFNAHYDRVTSIILKTLHYSKLGFVKTEFMCMLFMYILIELNSLPFGVLSSNHNTYTIYKTVFDILYFDARCADDNDISNQSIILFDAISNFNLQKPRPFIKTVERSRRILRK